MRKNFFATWSDNMAYYLGFIFADGSIDNNKLSLGNVTEDEEIISGFLREVESHAGIKRTPARLRKDGIRAAAFSSANVCCKQIVGDLTKCGVRPRKSFNDFSFPAVPDRFLSHFIRGYFDGDGSVFQTKQGYFRISLPGTKKFITGLRDAACGMSGLPKKKIIQHAQSKTTFFFDWASSEDIVGFFEYIYPTDDNYPCLIRKRSFMEKAVVLLREKIKIKGIGQHKHHGGRWRARWKGVLLGEYSLRQQAIFARDLWIDLLKCKPMRPCHGWRKLVAMKIESIGQKRGLVNG